MGRAGTVPTIGEVAAAFDAGSSVHDIAARFGCTGRSVRNVARRGRLVLPQARRRTARQARLADRGWLVAELLVAGRSVTSLAGELGCDSSQVRAAAAAAGVEVPPFRVPVRHGRLYQPGWLAAQLRAGRALTAIAGEVGCAAATVARAARRLGIVERRAHGEWRFPQLHDPGWLRRWYVDEGRSSTEIAAMLGCAPDSVLRALRAHHIPRRRGVAGRVPQLHDRAWLCRRYVVEGQGPTAIAAEVGCHPATVLKALHRARITPRGRATYPRLDDAGWLRRRYAGDGSSMAAIAAEVGCHPATVGAALRRAGIRRPQQQRGGRPPVRQLRADWRRSGSVAGVARVNGVGRRRAEVWLAGAGIFSPGARRLPAGELGAMAASGATQKAIAAHFGVEAQRVRVELLRHRLPGRPAASGRGRGRAGGVTVTAVGGPAGRGTVRGGRTCG